MEDDKAVHSGLLYLPPKEKFIEKFIVKKTWQHKYCLLYKGSKNGVERLEIFDNVEEASKLNGTPHKIITLENCVKVSKKSSSFFSVVTKSDIFDFSAPTEPALNQWISAIQSVCFKEDTKTTTLVEDNDLYCSIGEGIFNVKLHETDASLRCKLASKNYILMLTPIALQLREIADDTLLYNWPYQFVRRYGYSDGKFTFEAGRKCNSGEGKFLLEHPNEQEIFRYVTMKMKSMKQLLKSDSVPNLDCGDKQLQAMLSMEARSRSPLPPSPTTSTSLQDLAITDSVKSTKKHNPHAPPKPPRKTVPLKDDYELIENYDQIEFRNNAWQTLGVTDINHFEKVEINESFSNEKKSSTIDGQISKASKVIMEPDDDEYDKLNFFGSSSKLDMAGYKQVRTQNSVLPSPPSFNEYDEVHFLECIRPADDSHLGYALVRKKEPQIMHDTFNDTEYAVISKPKQV